MFMHKPAGGQLPKRSLMDPGVEAEIKALQGLIRLRALLRVNRRPSCLKSRRSTSSLKSMSRNWLKLHFSFTA